MFTTPISLDAFSLTLRAGSRELSWLKMSSAGLCALTLFACTPERAQPPIDQGGGGATPPVTETQSGSEAPPPPPSMMTWTTPEVYEGLAPSCVACHSAGQSLPLFESLSAFERLIVRDERWITAGEPERSPFLPLLAGDLQGGRYTQMPPAGQPYGALQEGLGEQRPPAPSIADLSGWVSSLDPDQLGEPEGPTSCAPLPSRTSLSRLSGSDYQRAVEDLLDTQLTLGADLPAENESYHFEHLAELLTISPLLIEKYDLAAQALAEEALPPPLGRPRVYWYEAEQDMYSSVGAARETYWNLWSVGELSASIELEYGGPYELTARVGGGQAGGEPVRFAILVDGLEVAQGSTWAQSPEYEAHTFSVPLEVGAHTLSVRFLNDYYCPEERFAEGACAERGDRNLHLDSLSVEGPIGLARAPSAFERRYLRCELDALSEDRLSELELEACGRETARAFLRVLWRGAIDEASFERVWSLAAAELSGDEGSGSTRLNRGLRQLVYAGLLSPRFLLKEEGSAAGEQLSGYERATRLASLIWRSVPDEELLRAAEAGELSSEEGLTASVARMLDDPRAARLAEEFGGRWLTLHHLEGAAPDYQRFPDFDEGLRDAMAEESLRLLRSILRERQPLLNLIDAQFTWLNPRLAEHYGLSELLSDELGDDFQRVELPQGGRLGALTHGAWLTVTSHPTRTSPVVRGKWVLENLLCTPPPPPPPGVEGLITEVDQSASVRERLEQHRADPSCAACHTHMDAIGFGFEQLDATGAFRLSDGGQAIDPSGLLPPVMMGAQGEEGQPFSDAVSLVRALRRDPRVERCVAERFIIYALGRGLLDDERCFVEELISEASAEGMSFQALVKAVTLSPLFLMRGEVR